MVSFWIVAALLAAAAVCVVILAAASSGRRPVADVEVETYSRALQEVDALQARGLLDGEDHAAMRSEAGRRLLMARAGYVGVEPGGSRFERRLVLALALGGVLVGAGLYGFSGSPGKGDQPYRERVAAWRARDPATLSPEQIVAVLEDLARERPRDARLQAFLGRARAEAGDPYGAVEAFRAATALEPRRAAYWTALGEGLSALETGPGEAAEAAFRRALALDPTDQGARYGLGRVALTAGRRDDAVRLWRGLAEGLAATDPRRGPLLQEIAAAERGEGARQTPQPTDAAADQETMIRSMVARLADRLKAAPDDPEGWTRLVRAYAVLGDKAALTDALTSARRRYADRPDVLNRIEAAARPPA